MHVVARLVGDGADEIDVKAREFLRLRVEEFKGREGRFRTDAQNVARLRVREGCTRGKKSAGKDSGFLERHGGFLMGFGQAGGG